jgi:hypothetical protein
MFFADLSRFRFIMLDSTGQRLLVANYGRGCKVWDDCGKRKAPEACGLSGALAVFLRIGWTQKSEAPPVIKLV